MEIVQRIIDILEEMGIKPSKMSADLGFSSGLFSQWKSGKQKPSMEKLRLMADYLNVSVDYLLGTTESLVCPFCGFSYISTIPSELKAHEANHKKWETAVKFFGFCWPYSERENIKHTNRAIANDVSHSVEDRCNAYLNVIKSYFSRSLEGCDYSLSHPNFDEYASLYLNNIHEDVSVDVIATLAKRYGKKPGMDGTYWSPAFGEKHKMRPRLELSASIRPVGKPIPVLGVIRAGVPILAEDHIIGYEFADVSHPEEYFFLQVSGDSMINAGILPGSKVLIHQQDCAEDGQIVACIVNGDEATLKRFKCKGDVVLLMPENPTYEPILVSCREFESGYARILGVAKKVLSDL